MNNVTRKSPLSLQDFEGRWQVERQIDDRQAGQVLSASGEARFSAADYGLIYEETLQISVGQQVPLKATRTYLWKASLDGIDVHFQDGRFFHQIALEHTRPSDHHACAPDSYAVNYDFTCWPNWSAQWTVTGPRKDYVMTSRYQRREAN